MIAANPHKKEPDREAHRSDRGPQLGTRAPGGSRQPTSACIRNTIPAGAYVTLNVRVPGEQPGAYAYKVVVQMPPGFTDVDTETSPVGRCTNDHETSRSHSRRRAGPVNQEVSAITWAGDRSALGRIDNGFFVQFPLSIAIADRESPGRSARIQDGRVTTAAARTPIGVGPPSANYPAPTVNITKAGGVIEDVAGG